MYVFQYLCIFVAKVKLMFSFHQSTEFSVWKLINVKAVMYDEQAAGSRTIFRVTSVSSSSSSSASPPLFLLFLRSPLYPKQPAQELLYPHISRNFQHHCPWLFPSIKPWTAPFCCAEVSVLWSKLRCPFHFFDYSLGNSRRSTSLCLCTSFNPWPDFLTSMFLICV